MAPPTGASDSILVLRRNGASVDYHGALAPHLKNYPMEANESKLRKSWGERWTVNKTGRLPIESQMIETSNFMVHPDYLHKYGTLSNGVLTKSIKYAETWLYGTVGVRAAPTQRPSLFLYPGVVPSHQVRRVNQTGYHHSPVGSFLNVPAPNFSSKPDHSIHVVSQPRKHVDPCNSRLYQCSETGTTISPDVVISKKQSDKKSGTCRNTLTKARVSLRDSGPGSVREKRNSSSDPYNLMRKSRLGGVGVVGGDSQMFAFEGKKRNASVSPMRNQNRETSGASFETFKPKTFKEGKEAKLWMRDDREDEWTKPEEEVVTRRKSILECNVNAYELNKSKTREGKEEGEDEDEDDDSSDELIGQTSAKPEPLKIMRPKLNKTEVQIASGGKPQDSEKTKVQAEQPNGKKFNIFDNSKVGPPVAAEGYLSDNEEARTTTTSPKRPPRRQKEKALFGEAGLRYSKIRSKSSPNLSIKSILKKPATGGEEVSNLVEVPVEKETQPTSSPATQSDNLQASDQSSKNQSHCTLKKKKQVQFRVNNSYESLDKVQDQASNACPIAACHDARDKDTRQKPDEPESFNCNLKETDPMEVDDETRVPRSKSCEDLACLALQTTKDCSRKNEPEPEIEPEQPDYGDRTSTDEFEPLFPAQADDSPGSMPGLRRSYSDRRRTWSSSSSTSSSSALHKDERTISPFADSSSGSLFNDTMALRSRATKLDTREVFLTLNSDTVVNNNKSSEEKHRNKTGNGDFTIRSDGQNGTVKKLLAGNVISYAEFTKLSESPSQRKQSNAAKSKAKAKSKVSLKSYIPVKSKSLSPSPPPRQAQNEIFLKDKADSNMTLKNGKKPMKTFTTATTTTTTAVPTTTATATTPEDANRIKENDSSPSAVTLSGGSVRGFETEATDRKTVVRLGTGFQDSSHSETAKKPSITIHPKNIISKEEPKRKTSVIISNFQGANKVTISVRNESSDGEPNSSTCTIIETGSNSTVIPVVSTDNKTTLIVGSNTPVASPIIDNNDSDPLSSFMSQSADQSEIAKPEKLNRYIFSTVQTEADKTVEMLDPVEAVRRNLVPHICGREEGSPSLMEKIKQSRERNRANEQKSLKQISQLFVKPADSDVELSTTIPQPSESLISSYRNKKSNSTNGPSKPDAGDSSAATSRSNSFCSTLNSSTGKNSSSSTSRSNSFRSACQCNDATCTHNTPLTMANSKFYVLSDADDSTVEQEKDKLECEYEIRNGFKENEKGTETETENIYEMIKEEPIYDQIGVKKNGEDSEEDVPPPLPLTLPPSSPASTYEEPKSMFEGASKYDILNYLVDAKERVQEDSYFSGSSTSGEDTECKRLCSLEGSDRLSPNLNARSVNNSTPAEIDSELGSGSQVSYLSEDNLMLTSATAEEKEPLKLTRKSSTEIERNDSGVGSETSHTSRSKWQVSSSIREVPPHHLCEDCDQVVETQITDGGVMYVPLVCRKCGKKRSERKEIIQEIVETEEKYGRDLKIILEEFHTPMLVAGLLTSDQLSSIFLNTEELLENSEVLTERLRDTLEIALEQGDEDLLTVNVGKIFLEAEPMLHAFESYCTRQGSAAMLLANLEKEKELLRIFLRVSQMENAVLRRMNLNSFLMVPVQRVTKYPLLLARLYKVTPAQQEGRELLKEAQHNIELHLEHMNSEAKDVSATKVWRRFSTSTISGRKSTTESEMVNIKLRKMAVDVLDWNHEEVRFILEGKLLYTQPTDNNWKRGRTIKLTPAFVLLVTLGKPNAKYKVDPGEDELTFPTKTGIREATLLLVKEKCGRYTLIREPLYLDKIIVCCETEMDEYFEVQELSTKDSFIFKAEDGDRTKEWYKQLQYHAQILGAWRKRRNALANIMINGMMTRACTS